jgi:hypothetical protein
VTTVLAFLLLASMIGNALAWRRGLLWPEPELEPMPAIRTQRYSAVFFPTLCRRALKYEGFTDCCARSSLHNGRCMCQLEIDAIADAGHTTIVPVTAIDGIAFDDATIA